MMKIDSVCLALLIFDPFPKLNSAYTFQPRRKNVSMNSVCIVKQISNSSSSRAVSTAGSNHQQVLAEHKEIRNNSLTLHVHELVRKLFRKHLHFPKSLQAIDHLRTK